MEFTLVNQHAYARLHIEIKNANSQIGTTSDFVNLRFSITKGSVISAIGQEWNPLKRLNTDHVELYYMHEYDPACSWAEIWDTFEAERDAGKFIYAGASNFKARQLCYAQAEAEKRNIQGLACTQFNYNLVNRMPEEEVIPAAYELGLGSVIWSPLGGGYLTGSPLRNTGSGQRSHKYAGKLTDAARMQLESYKKLCDDFGESEANVALAWILHDPRITGPIIGPRTYEQFMDLLKCMEIKLPEDMVQQINTLFPNPRELTIGR